MRRIVAIAALLTALPAAAAYAQFNTGAGAKTPLELQEEERKRLRQEDDRNYQSTVRRRTNEAAPTSAANDPWANVRSAPGPSKQ